MANTTAKYFEAGNGPYSGAYVGTGNGSGANALSTCYFQFKTGDSGATKISFQTSNATADVRGSSHSDDGIAAMRFAVSTSSTQYKTTKSSTAGYAAEGSYGKYIKGSLSIKLLPNTTYYLWVFPNSSFPGTTRFALGSCTVTLTGTYGTASTISASSGTFGNAVTITLANSVSGVTNTVSLSFTAGNHSYSVTTSGIKRDGTTIQGSGGLVKNSDAKYTWTPTLSQYGAWITSAKSVTVTITCATSYGSSSWGSSTKPITMTFPNSCAPTLSLSSPTYDNTGSDAASIAKFVQGYSKLRVTASATPQYSASISKYEIIYNGVTTSINSSDTSKVLTTSNSAVSSGTVTATIRVTDTRGFVTTGTQDFTILPYANPVLESVELLRCKKEGTQYVEDEGGVYLSAKATGSISSLDSGNEIISLIVECNKAADNTSMFAPYTSANLTNNPQTADVFSGLDPNYTWIATVTITDKLGNSASFRQTISSQKWAMKFNSTATAVGFGKAPEADKVLEIPYDWKLARQNQAATETHYALFDNDSAWTGALSRIANLEGHAYIADVKFTFGSYGSSFTVTAHSSRNCTNDAPEIALSSGYTRLCYGIQINGDAAVQPANIDSYYVANTKGTVSNSVTARRWAIDVKKATS